MTGRILVVCTANVCRSPVAAGLLQRALGSSDDAWSVRSAGTASFRAALDPNTVAAAADAGLDLATHVPRHLGRDVLQHDGADLVLTMTRAHLREVVAIDASWWPRAFTLKELVRRASAAPPGPAGEPLADWLGRLAVGRRAAAMLRPDPADDVDDPYGMPRRAHVEMVRQLRDLIDVLVRLGPWRAPPASPDSADPRANLWPP
jgi:protein-tyrosine phosphatase